MIEGCTEGLRGRVVRQTQDVATPDAGQPTGASDEQEAQGAHAPDRLRIGAFPRPRFGLRENVELEAAAEVVREDAELLPGTVGPVVVGRNDIEGELALELGDGLFLGPGPLARSMPVSAAAGPTGQPVHPIDALGSMPSAGSPRPEPGIIESSSVFAARVRHWKSGPP